MGELVPFRAFKAHRVRRGVAIHYRPTFDRSGAEFAVTLRPYAVGRVFATYAAACDWAENEFVRLWRDDYRRRLG